MGRVSNHASSSANNNNSGGNIMSSKKRATRRLPLLAGSSLVAASAAVFAFAGASLAPSLAVAANECGDPTTNGASADTFICTGDFGAITYPATSGNLTLRLQGPVTVTGGIAVTPTGTNSVTINRLADATEGSGDPSISNTAGAAINVDRATGGTITLTLTDADAGDEPQAITGTTAGIRTRNADTGATNITFGITLGLGSPISDNGTVTASNGIGIDTGTTGTGAININLAQMIVSGTTAAVSAFGGGDVSLANGGFNPQENRSRLEGRVLFTNTGNTTFTNRGDWAFEGTSTLRNTSVLTGSATLTSAGLITTTGETAAINFGQGTGTFNNDGFLAPGSAPGSSTLTLAGVDTWNNRGQVIFGLGADLSSDGEGNDRIVLTNGTAATFNGIEEIGPLSLLVMDVDFTASQASCAAAVTADCLDLRGHNTAGTSAIQVNMAAPGLSAERIVLVDVAGSGTDAITFRISEESAGFRDLGEGLVDGGLFLYELVHDASAKQHVLLPAAVDEEAVEINLLSRAALPAWDATTGSWFDRQADLRNTLRGRAGGGMSPGGWLRVAGAFANHNEVSSLQVGGDRVDVITSSTQDTVAVVGGIDLVGSMDAGAAWVGGVTFGQVSSELGLKESANSMELDGFSLGAYLSYVGEHLFLDAIMSTTQLDAEYDGQSLGIALSGEAETLGYRLEGGWRMAWSEGVFFEPIASFSYVKTDLNEMPIASGVSAEFDSLTNLRGSLGARLSGDIPMGGVTLHLAGLGRVWEEFDGETHSSVNSGFGDFKFADLEADGTTGEVGLSLGLFGMDGRLSAQLAGGVKFREQYQSVDVSLSARYQW